MLADEEFCPVPVEMLGQLYRASSHGLDELITTVPGETRALLALYCFRRGHLTSIGLAIAASCTEQDLAVVGGRADLALYDMARERPVEMSFDSRPTGRRKITMPSGTLRDMSHLKDVDPDLGDLTELG